MTAGGLFSGIGGIELAAEMCGIEVVWSNEMDPYCCRVLRKNFNHLVIEDKIQNIGKGRTHELEPVDILFGGPPCQPFSTAGKRKGTDDDRHLWPEMFRLVRELGPRWVIVENVAGLVSMDNGAVLEQICADLEAEGYQVQPYLIPACGVGAPHKRERIFIIAYADDKQRERSRESRRGRRQFANCSSELAADTSEPGLPNGRGAQDEQAAKEPQRQNGLSDAADTDCKGLAKRESFSGYTQQKQSSAVGRIWQEHWFQVATRIRRMDAGLSKGMDGAGGIPAKPKKKKAAGRKHRLKALGNSVNPWQIKPIFDAILAYEKEITGI